MTKIRKEAAGDMVSVNEWRAKDEYRREKL